MSQYQKIDELIFKRLSPVNALDFSSLHCGSRQDECDRLSIATGRESFRVMDARLQALRKRGIIEFVSQPGNRGWVVKT